MFENIEMTMTIWKINEQYCEIEKSQLPTICSSVILFDIVLNLNIK